MEVAGKVGLSDAAYRLLIRERRSCIRYTLPTIILLGGIRRNNDAFSMDVYINIISLVGIFKVNVEM